METKSFLTLEDVGREDIREILDLARAFAEGRVRDALEGKTVCLAFFEASTRTAVSFELAARRSGAHVISLSAKGSAIAKGESLIDTVVTLDRLGADAIVLRHQAAGAAALAARHTSAPVINAGDGCGQHPTQALLDLYALSSAIGGFDELADRKVAVVGDILHSRVARSMIPAFRAADMEVALVAPETLLPLEAGAWELPILPSVDDALDWGADTLYALRLQKERMTGARIPSVAEYARYYGVAGRHLKRGVLVMHQVASGVAVRSAVLALATGAVEEAAA